MKCGLCIKCRRKLKGCTKRPLLEVLDPTPEVQALRDAILRATSKEEVGEIIFKFLDCNLPQVVKKEV